MYYGGQMRFEWDPAKEKANVRKHHVSFEDAKQALQSGLVIVLKDDSDSGEERFVYLGMCKKLKVLVVVVAYPDDDITRIISARKATRKEREYYETKL